MEGRTSTSRSASHGNNESATRVRRKIYIPKSFYMNVNFLNFCINTFSIYEQIPSVDKDFRVSRQKCFSMEIILSLFKKCFCAGNITFSPQKGGRFLDSWRNQKFMSYRKLSLHSPPDQSETFHDPERWKCKWDWISRHMHLIQFTPHINEGWLEYPLSSK